MGRFFFTSLYCITLAATFIAFPVTGQNKIANEKLSNDSVQYYFDLSRYKEASTILEHSESRPKDATENVRSKLLKAQVSEAEGYSAKALEEYKQAFIHRSNTSDQSILNKISLGIASTQLAVDRMDSVIWYCDKALTYDSSAQSKASVSLVKARFWQNQNQYDQAMHFYQEAEALATKIQDKKLLGLAFTGLGMVYFNQFQDMDRALEYYGKAVKSYDSLRHANEIARSLTRMANAMMVLGKGKEAGEYLMRAKKIIDISDNLPVKTYVLASIAILKTDAGDFKEVVRYGEEALLIKRQLGMKKQMQNDLLNLSGWYVELKQYKKAKGLLSEAMSIARELKDVVYLHYFYETTAALDSITGDYASAYANLKKGIYYKDSVYSVRRVKAVEEIRAKYEHEQKEKIIAEKELVIQTQQNHLLVIIVVAVVSVLVLVLVLFWLRTRQRARLQLERERQSRARLQSIVATQEEVQQSIARDIHDGLVQVLGAAKMSLQAVDVNGQSDLVRERIQHASQIMDEACTEARNISHQLLPYSLIKDGLRPAIEELLKKGLGKTEFEFYSSLNNERFPQEIEINLYRIAQEIIQNIYKHSNATKVAAELNAAGKTLTLKVIDNGQGFNTATAMNGAGFMNMKTRADLIGADFFLASQPREGTSVTVIVKI